MTSSASIAYKPVTHSDTFSEQDSNNTTIRPPLFSSSTSLNTRGYTIEEGRSLTARVRSATPDSPLCLTSKIAAGVGTILFALALPFTALTCTSGCKVALWLKITDSVLIPAAGGTLLCSGGLCMADVFYCTPRRIHEAEEEFDNDSQGLANDDLLLGAQLQKYYKIIDDSNKIKLNYTQLAEIYSYDSQWIREQVENDKFNLEQTELWRMIIDDLPRQTIFTFRDCMKTEEFIRKYKEMFGFAIAVHEFTPQDIMDHPEVITHLNTLRNPY